MINLYDEEVCGVYNLTPFGIGKYDCVMNTKAIFSFCSLINKSVTTRWSFLLLVTSAIASSNTINAFLFFPAVYSLLLMYTFFISFEYLVKASESLNCFRLKTGRLLIRSWYLDSYISLEYRQIWSISN